MSSKDYFDSIAQQWDDMRTGFFSESVREKALAASGVQPGALVADVGAGTGFVTADLVAAGARVIAIDQSAEMLEQMKSNFPGVDAIDYRVGEAEHLPIDDDTVDYVFANMYLHHVETPPDAVKEMVRILKPGGKLVITDADEHQHEFLLKEHHDRWPGFKRDDIRLWFTGAGLTSVSVDCTDENCCASSQADDVSADISIFIAKGVKMSNSEFKEGIHESVREHYGAIARYADREDSAPSCCGSASDEVMDVNAVDNDCGCGEDSHATNLYGVTSLEDLPVDVTGMSLGCGDPVTIAGLKPGETVLDLGSGGGIDCFLAAKQVGETGHVIGVDMTPDMLQKANKNKAKLGAQNVEFRQGQIEDMPVDDNSIDVIMSNCVINLSPDKAAVFREVYRVLKPGGRVSVSDIVTEGEFSEEMRADAAQWAGCVSGAVDVSEYTGLMREAGLVDVQVVDKVSAEDKGVHVEPAPGVPHVYSARVTAQKPL